MQRLNFFADTFVRRGVSLLELASNHVHFRLRLRNTHARLEPRHRHEPMILPRRIPRARWIDRLPQVNAVAVKRSEAWSHDSDYRRGNTGVVIREAFPKHPRVAIEMPLPKRITNNYGLREFLLFVGNKGSSQYGFDAQQTEKIRRDVLNVNRLGSVLTRKNGGFRAAR